MKVPHKTLERKLFKSGYRVIYAVDEVGMGCLAGPVVVCAVAMTSRFYKKAHKKLRWLRDSKLLQAKQREEYAEKLISDKDIKFKLACVHPKTIDRLNIYNASRLAMKKAVKKLECRRLSVERGINSKKPHSTFYVPRSIVLVDGRGKIPGLTIDQLPTIKGDRKVFAIACASIIAKVYRDKMMIRYAKKYPGYGFEKHKGYGTKYHQVQLASLGPCKIHRGSFRLQY